MDIIYSRVSKQDEKLQDLEIQEKIITEKFHLVNPLILKERGTAFKLEKVKDREEFIKLLDICFDSKHKTLEQIYLQEYEKKQIRLFVWDLNRIMRNLKFNLLFSVLAAIHEVKIFSYHDGEINTGKQDSDDEFIRLLFAMLAAKKAEDYSRDISKNIKKAVDHKEGITFSNDGKKWGKQFTGIDGKNVTLTAVQIVAMNERILEGIRGGISYDSIINRIETGYGVILSKAYISKLRRLHDENRKEQSTA